MTTIQDYECPVHGRFEVAVPGDTPDTWTCAVDDGWGRCGQKAEWRPSAPPVHTPDTRRRALVGHARDTNPW